MGTNSGLLWWCLLFVFSEHHCKICLPVHQYVHISNPIFSLLSSLPWMHYRIKDWMEKIKITVVMSADSIFWTAMQINLSGCLAIPLSVSVSAHLSIWICNSISYFLFSYFYLGCTIECTTDCPLETRIDKEHSEGKETSWGHPSSWRILKRKVKKE